MNEVTPPMVYCFLRDTLFLKMVVSLRRGVSLIVVSLNRGQLYT